MLDLVKLKKVKKKDWAQTKRQVMPKKFYEIDSCLSCLGVSKVSKDRIFFTIAVSVLGPML
jgi:hypothetical protein